LAGTHSIGGDVGLPDVGKKVGAAVLGLKEGTKVSSEGDACWGILVGLEVETTGCLVGTLVVGLSVVDELVSQTSCLAHSRPKNIEAQQASKDSYM
jgi:hypothetical protein